MEKCGRPFVCLLATKFLWLVCWLTSSPPLECGGGLRVLWWRWKSMDLDPAIGSIAALVCNVALSSRSPQTSKRFLTVWVVGIYYAAART